MKRSKDGNAIWLSENDTYKWATKPDAYWPCSGLSGRRVFAAFDSNGLCDLVIDGGKGEQDCDASELTAMLDDFIRGNP